MKSALEFSSYSKFRLVTTSFAILEAGIESFLSQSRAFGLKVMTEQDTVPLSMGKTDSDSSEAMPFPDNFMPNGLDIKFEEQQAPAAGKRGRTSLEIFQNSFQDFSVSSYSFTCN